MFETWSLALREEYRLGVFESRVLRRIFGPKRDEVTGEWRKLHSKEFRHLYSSQILLCTLNQGECGRLGVWQVLEKRERRMGFWWETPKERVHSEDLVVDGRI
jgi:hypothetical protein